MTARCCPTCGHDLPDGLVPVEALIDAALTPQQLIMIDVMIRAYPRPVTVAALIGALWGDDPNGGPENARAVLQVQITHVRKIIRGHGWTIPTNTSGNGVHHGSRYRLVRQP